MEIDRRSLLRGTLAVAAGAAVTVGSEEAARLWRPHRLPLGGGYAPAADQLSALRAGSVNTVWQADVADPVVALTFDDGPLPDWTPMVLDRLDEVDAPATFFMIGAHLRAHRALVDGRLARHEVGNHTWNHADLAERDLAGTLDELRRAHDEIAAATGRPPRVMRPPWGHMGGATLLAASAMRYDLILWSAQTHAAAYGVDASGQVAALVRAADPGTIILAHDVGDPARLPTLKVLPDLVTGLRDKGLRLVTVSELLAARRTGPPA